MSCDLLRGVHGIRLWRFDRVVLGEAVREGFCFLVLFYFYFIVFYYGTVGRCWRPSARRPTTRALLKNRVALTVSRAVGAGS